MKKIVAIILLLCVAAGSFAGEEEMWTMTDDAAFYAATTRSAEFNYKATYTPISLTPHDLFQDIKVSAVESVPFAFLYTFAGLWISKALKYQTFSPALGQLDDPENKAVFITTISCFAAINVLSNVLGYYKYETPSAGAVK